MGIKRIILLVIVALAICSDVRATEYATKGLERLASCVGLDGLASLPPGIHYIYTQRLHTGSDTGRQIRTKAHHSAFFDHVCQKEEKTATEVRAFAYQSVTSFFTSISLKKAKKQNVRNLLNLKDFRNAFSRA